MLSSSRGTLPFFKAAPLAFGVFLSGVCASAVRAQVVYDSTANPVLPAAMLAQSLNPAVNERFVTDDFTTILSGTSNTFYLSTLSFYGGVDFTGAPDGTNNVLRFRFLNEFGGIESYSQKYSFTFQNTGTQFYTLNFGNVIVPTKGILEVTTLRDSNANGTFALSSTGPQVGANNPAVGAPAQGSGVRAFSLNGSINGPGVPEPGTFALLIAGAAPLALIARRRKA